MAKKVTTEEVEDALRVFYAGDGERLSWDQWHTDGTHEAHRNELRGFMRRVLESFVWERAREDARRDRPFRDKGFTPHVTGDGRGGPDE